ncbi:uncharacterized protein LOC118433982 [Folsomia candida]|nr:uncharacterized protein LOC118433982 [Folsomia candida]
MVQGILVFFMLKHRYMGVTQMAEMRHFTVQKYKNLTDSYNHAAFTSGRMATFHSNVASLHDDDWKPLYDLVNIPNYSGFGECQHCQIIGTWLLNRCAHRDRRDLVEKEVREFVKERIHLNSALEMKGFWGDLIVLLAGDKFGYEIVAKCSQVVNCIWELLRDAVDNGMVDVEDIRQRGINGYIELIELGRKTRAISEGHILGRAMVGSLTLMADRTDVSVFQRILDAVLEHWEKVVGI